MNIKNTFIAIPATGLLALLVFTSCSKTAREEVTAPTPTQAALQEKTSEQGSNPDDVLLSKKSNTVNYFYIESNGHGLNTVLAFKQKENGQLVLQDEVTSGGYGYHQALGSQGAIAISKEYNLLFAVNPGSNSVSSFKINPASGGLQLLFTVTTNGQLPNSITVHGNRMYVLHKLSSSICGFSFTANGFMSMIEGSTHNLSGMAVDAPEIKFQPDGKALYVTEKVTNLIDKFELDNSGAISSVNFIISYGITPFGFDYGRNGNYLVATNAANGFSGAGSASSYSFSQSQGLVTINGASNFESAPCWLATTKNGVYAFISNTASNNLSSYYIDPQGKLSLLKAVAAQDGQAPIDIAVSTDNNYVYNIYSGSHTVVAYKRQAAGVIEFTDKVTSLPKYAVGLAVY